MGRTSTLLFLVVVTAVTATVDGGYPPSTSYGYPAPKHNPYLPAPPGMTPYCAKKGATFCEKIDTYPTEAISYLLYKYGHTYQQFIKSESDRDFILISKTYGPAPYDTYKPPQGEVTGGYSDTPSSSYLPQQPYNHNYNNQNNRYTSGSGSGSGGRGNFSSNSNSRGNGGGGKQYVASYYRNPNQNQNRYQREHQPQGQGQGQGGYGYSFAIPPRDQNHNQNQNQNQNQYQHLDEMTENQRRTLAAVPPIIHSIWWNHRDANNNMAFPHMGMYNQQRFKRRVKRQTSETSLCPLRARSISPQAAMNNEGNWMFVINMDQTPFRQLVRSEECALGDGSPCNTGLCSPPPGFSASCKQKYVQKRLVALQGSGAEFSNEVFWFAHGCSCEVTQ